MEPLVISCETINKKRSKVSRSTKERVIILN